MADKPIMPGDTITLKAAITNPRDSDAAADPASGCKAYLKSPKSGGTVIDAAGSAMSTSVTGFYTLAYLIPNETGSEGIWTYVAVPNDSALNSDDVTFEVVPKIIRTYP